MYEIEVTSQFTSWFESLKDRQAKARISTRIERLAQGHFGDWKQVNESVGELRLHFGPGYRLYFKRRGRTIIILLCGGDKAHQGRDIEMATTLAERD